MDLARLQQMLGMGGGASRGPQSDAPQPDTAEKIQISSLSLLKMLKHGLNRLLVRRSHYSHDLHHTGRAGVPMEVMGLMLGQFVDDYTITCVDVFAMPQVRNILILSYHLFIQYAITKAWNWC